MDTFSIARVAVVIAGVAIATANAQRGSKQPVELQPTSEQGIDEAMFVPINGVEQWIAIRARDIHNPVLLWLHGGPGGAGGTLFAPVFKDWERYYTVVQWDKPGGGGTYGKNVEAGLEDLTIDRIARDGVAVAEYLRNRLEADKILLMGISWGTIIGLEMVHERSDLFSAYVGTAQHASGADGRRTGYELALEAARQRHDSAAIEALQQIGPPPYESVDDFVVRQRYALPGLPFSEIQAAANAEYFAIVTTPPPPDAKYVARGLPEYDGVEAFMAVQRATFQQVQRWKRAG